MTKHELKKSFAKLRSPKRFSSKWIMTNYPTLYREVRKQYHKPYWASFLRDIGQGDKILMNPRKMRIQKYSRELLAYWKKEHDMQLHKAFSYSSHFGIPTTKEKESLVNPRQIHKAIEYMKKRNVIRTVKRGDYHAISQYVLLRNTV